MNHIITIKVDVTVIDRALTPEADFLVSFALRLPVLQKIYSFSYKLECFEFQSLYILNAMIS